MVYRYAPGELDDEDYNDELYAPRFIPSKKQAVADDDHRKSAANTKHRRYVPEDKWQHLKSNRPGK